MPRSLLGCASHVSVRGVDTAHTRAEDWGAAAPPQPQDALLGLAERGLVVVHARDESSAAFYEKYGFSRFADNPLYLYLTTRDLRATFSNADLG